MRTQLNNQISAAVLDKNGRKIDEREFVNTPFAHLFPQDEFVVIDWLANSTTERPEETELSQPVTYNGKQWQGSWAWGLAVKTGQTVGLLHDTGHECQMIKNAEDGQRFNRWLLAQGLWGGVSGDFKIAIAKPGTVVSGMPIEDGFGCIKREVAEAGYNGLNKIKLGQAKESYTFWQRIPWDEIAEEVSPIIAFPEASRWIVTEKPGLKNKGLATILTGCNYQVPGLEELETEVEVVDVTTEKNGKQWVRKAICGEWMGSAAAKQRIPFEHDRADCHQC